MIKKIPKLIKEVFNCVIAREKILDFINHCKKCKDCQKWLKNQKQKDKKNKVGWGKLKK